MTSKGFERAAKCALVNTIRSEYNEDYVPHDIHMVWFSYVLGNCKGLFIDRGPNARYYEVTYSVAKDEMYLDIYEKKSNRKILLPEDTEG